VVSNQEDNGSRYIHRPDSAARLASASHRRQRLYDASASASSRPYSRNRISIGSFWRRTGVYSPSILSHLSTYRRRARPGAAPGDRESRRRDAALLINHLAQFPATTVASIWRRAPRSDPASPIEMPSTPWNTGQHPHHLSRGGARLPQQPEQRTAVLVAASSSCTSCSVCSTRASSIPSRSCPPALAYRRVAGSDAGRRRPHIIALIASSCSSLVKKNAILMIDFCRRRQRG